MVSNDTSMLEQERELAVLGYTHLTLVAPLAAGHDPFRSTGLVLAHIEDIAARTTPRRPRCGACPVVPEAEIIRTNSSKGSPRKAGWIRSTRVRTPCPRR